MNDYENEDAGYFDGHGDYVYGPADFEGEQDFYCGDCGEELEADEGFEDGDLCERCAHAQARRRGRERQKLAVEGLFEIEDYKTRTLRCLPVNKAARAVLLERSGGRCERVNIRGEKCGREFIAKASIRDLGGQDFTVHHDVKDTIEREGKAYGRLKAYCRSCNSLESIGDDAIPRFDRSPRTVEAERHAEQARAEGRNFEECLTAGRYAIARMGPYELEVETVRLDGVAVLSVIPRGLSDADKWAAFRQRAKAAGKYNARDGRGSYAWKTREWNRGYLLLRPTAFGLRRAARAVEART